MNRQCRQYRPEERQDLTGKVMELVESHTPPKACKLVGVPYPTFRHWIAGNEVLLTSYARAKVIFLESIAEEIREMLDAPSITNDKGNVDHGEVQLRKLRVEHLRWLLSKLDPKTYGDRLTVAGDDDHPLVVGVVQRVVVDNRKQITEDD